MAILKQYLVAFLIIFFTSDVIYNFPLLLNFTETLSSKQKTKIIREAIVSSFLWILALCIAGYYVLPLCGLAIFDMMCAGGIVIMALSLFALLSSDSSRFLAKRKHSHDFGLASPLTVFIAGPSLVVTSFVLPQFIDMLTVIFALFLNCLLVWFLLEKLPIIERLAGKRGIMYSAKIHKIIAFMIGLMIMHQAFTKM